MRILLIHPHDIYSHVEPWTVRIEHLAREFTARGHDVKLVYFPLDFTPEDLRARTHPDGYQTIPLCRWRKKLLTNIRRMIPLARWADVVHIQKCHSWATVPAIFGAYIARKPLHYDWDDWELAIYRYDPPSVTTGYFLSMFEGLLPGMVNTITVASEALRQMALAQGFPRENIFDGHVGADTLRFHPEHDGRELRRQLGIDAKVVMYLGQLHGAQYAELFVLAAHYLALHRPELEWRFVVVGHGGRFAELQELTRQLGLADLVTFSGAIEHVKVPRYLAAADVVVACFEDNEQQRTKSPLKIAEYMACGTSRKRSSALSTALNWRHAWGLPPVSEPWPDTTGESPHPTCSRPTSVRSGIIAGREAGHWDGLPRSFAVTRTSREFSTATGCSPVPSPSSWT